MILKLYIFLTPDCTPGDTLKLSAQAPFLQSGEGIAVRNYSSTPTEVFWWGEGCMTENLTSTRMYPASGHVMPGEDPGQTSMDGWMDG